MAKQMSALIDGVNDRARFLQTERNCRSTEEMEQDKSVPASFGISPDSKALAAASLHLVSE
jgi:hypothetical protein